MTNQELGKIAYNAYCDVCDWKSAISGANLPEFEATPALVQAAWRIAAKTVADAVTAPVCKDSKEPYTIEE